MPKVALMAAQPVHVRRRAWFLRRMPARAVTSFFCLTAALSAVATVGWCTVQRVKVDRDTPAICRIYLEQDAFTLGHFGHLRAEEFQSDESVSFEETAGVTRGVYTYLVTGTRAKGKVRMAWVREAGEGGSLQVDAIEVLRLQKLPRVQGEGRTAPVSRHPGQGRGDLSLVCVVY